MPHPRGWHRANLGRRGTRPTDRRWVAANEREGRRSRTDHPSRKQSTLSTPLDMDRADRDQLHQDDLHHSPSSRSSAEKPSSSTIRDRQRFHVKHRNKSRAFALPPAGGERSIRYATRTRHPTPPAAGTHPSRTKPLAADWRLAERLGTFNVLPEYSRKVLSPIADNTHPDPDSRSITTMRERTRHPYPWNAELAWTTLSGKAGRPHQTRGPANDQALAPGPRFAPHNRHVETTSPPALFSARFT